MNKKSIIYIVILLIIFIVGYVLVRRVEAPNTPTATDTSQESDNKDVTGDITKDTPIDTVIGIQIPDVGTITKEVENKEAVLLDVRTTKERDIDGFVYLSTSFDMERLKGGELPNIDTNTKIYVFATNGAEAFDAIVILSKNGFSNLTNIGGLTEWRNAGGDIIKMDTQI